jgi:hypothetical protein
MASRSTVAGGKAKAYVSRYGSAKPYIRSTTGGGVIIPIFVRTYFIDAPHLHPVNCNHYMVGPNRDLSISTAK